MFLFMSNCYLTLCILLLYVFIAICDTKLEANVYCFKTNVK